MKGLLILGMHRSGTSALAGQCASLGLWFGENLLPAQSDNPKGYYEDLGFMSANDLLVTLLFGGWDSPVAWSDAMRLHPIDHPRLSEVIDSSRNILDTLTTSGRAWAVKDPRLSRLLPLWWPYVGSMGVDVSILMAVRRPTEVAASLKQRDGLGPTTSRMLWMRHVAEPLAYALEHNLQIGIVPYDVLLRSPERLREILHTMGFRLQSPGTTFIDGTMRHHMHEAQPAKDALTNACEQLYRIAVAHPVFSRDTVPETDAGFIRAARNMSLQPYLNDIYFEHLGLSNAVDAGQGESKSAVHRRTQAETISKLRIENERLKNRVNLLKKQLENRADQLNKHVEMARKGQEIASHASTPITSAASEAVLGEKKRIVVHYHLYKAGGSTIIQGLRDRFGHDSLIEVDKHPSYAREKAYNIAFFERLAELHPSTVAYSAHRVVPNIHFSTKIDVFPITFIRHPLLRAISVYRFERIRKDEWPRKEIALKHDFAGWIDWCLQSEQIEARNTQSCLLSLNDNGQFISNPISKVRRGDLKLVYDRLDAMPVVGVVEIFRRSLEAINLAGQALFPGLKIAEDRVNSTKVVEDWHVELTTIEKLLPAELRSRFYAANEDDLALFERYRARFSE